MKRVLLVDDDELFNFLNKKLIEKTVFAKEIQVCNSGGQALSLLKRSIEAYDPLPEFIFLDVMMPVMDGFEFLEAFNALPLEITQNIQIAMLTSSLDPEDKKRALKYKQVVDFINKPLDREKISDLKLKIGWEEIS